MRQFSERVYRGLAHSVEVYPAGTYFTLCEDLANWYASNKFEEFEIEGWVVSHTLELDNVVILSTDEIEGLGYCHEAMQNYRNLGYDGARNESGSEVLCFHALRIERHGEHVSRLAKEQPAGQLRG